MDFYVGSIFKAVFLPVHFYKAIQFMYMVREIISSLEYPYSIYIKSKKSFALVSSPKGLDMFTNRKKCSSVLKKK